MIHITDAKTDEILSVIHEDEFWSDTHIKKLSLEETFYFETFADRPFAQYLADRNRVIIPDEDGRFVEFIIEEVEQLFDRTKSVYANASYIELRKQRVVDPQTLNSQSASTAVSYALNGTQWQAGTIKYTTLKNITIDKHMDAYTLLKLIATTFGLELNFRVEVKGSRVTGRYVDLIDRVGEWNGREVVFGSDLIGVKRVEKTDEVVTALIGLGPDTNDGTPRMESYVEDLDALQRWGKNGQHLVETYEPQTNSQNMTESQLKKLTEEELARRINASVEYEATIANLEAIPGLEHHTVRFGDTIRIKDEGFFPPLYLEARIHTQERSIKVEREKSFVLGDYIEYTAEEVMALFRALQAQINQAISQREIHVGMSPPEDVSQHWIDISREPNVLKRFDGTTADWVKVTPTEASEVGAATPQEVRDMSETERLKGHKITLFKEKTVIDERHAYLIVKPQMYTQSVKDELVASKANLNNMYSTLLARIDTAIADETITETERTNIETATENYRLAIARWEVAFADGEDDVNAGRTADAELASQDYVEEYAQQKIIQGTVAPSNPVTGDLWIDTSVNPYVWKQWSGSAWVKLTRTSLTDLTGTLSASQIAANTVTSNMISTAGLDAGVIKFGTMSGDRILANSINADRLKAGTVIASNITFTGTLSGASGTFKGKLTGSVIEVENPTAGYTYMHFKQGTESRKVRFGGNGSDAFLLQVDNPTYGNWNLENFYVNVDFTRFYGNALFYNGYNGEMIIAIDTDLGNITVGSGVTLRKTGSMELVSNGARPYIDFSNDLASDYDARLLLADDNTLELVGARHKITYPGESIRNEFASGEVSYNRYVRNGVSLGWFGCGTTGHNNLTMWSDNAITQFNGAMINTEGGHTRWQQSDSNYIMQTSGGRITMYNSGQGMLSFDWLGGAVGSHVWLTGGSVGFKFVQGSATLQARTSNDGGWGTFQGIISSQSTRDSKKDVLLWEHDAYEGIKSVNFYEYRYVGERDDLPKKYGIIAEEAPVEMLIDTRDGVDLYSYATYIGKALQQAITRIEELEKIIEGAN